MKILLSTVLTLLPLLYAEAQSKIWNTWRFGASNIGLSFNTTPPSYLEPKDNHMVSVHSGCASISDTNGNLLFYTGTEAVIWDKEHKPMPNGVLNNGTWIVNGDALIVPLPLDSSIYYVFSTNDSRDLAYSIVDMRLNNGDGDVVISQKDQVLRTGIYYGISATHHLNKQDFWITSLAYNGDSTFSYLMTPSG